LIKVFITKEILGFRMTLFSTYYLCTIAEFPTVPCWGRAGGGSQPLWSIGATRRKAQGRIFHLE
jgi:hypothetical protein